MAHFAKLDKSNIVIKVHVVVNAVIADADGNDVEQKGIDFLTDLHGTGWYKQTSYNGTFRKNYAGIGYTYDGGRDAFISPQHYPSWVLNEDTCKWESPIPYPDDGKFYKWDESSSSWKEIE